VEDPNDSTCWRKRQVKGLLQGVYLDPHVRAFLLELAEGGVDLGFEMLEDQRGRGIFGLLAGAGGDEGDGREGRGQQKTGSGCASLGQNL
jgi:hypothetical protein